MIAVLFFFLFDPPSSLLAGWGGWITSAVILVHLRQKKRVWFPGYNTIKYKESKRGEIRRGNTVKICKFVQVPVGVSLRQISEWRHAPRPRAAHTRYGRSSKTDFFLEPPVCIALGYNFGFVTFSFFSLSPSLNWSHHSFQSGFFRFVQVVLIIFLRSRGPTNFLTAIRNIKRHKLRRFVYVLLSYRIFSPYVNRQNLGSPSCYFLRIEYNSVNAMNARRRDNRGLDTETDFWCYIPLLCGNSNPNQLSNCFGSSLMSYSYVEEDDCIASLCWHQ